MRCLVYCLVIFLAVGVFSFCGSAPAAEAAAAGGLFAVVDMETVISQYDAYRQANDEFRRYYLEVERKLDLNRRLRLLGDAELQELQDLRKVVALTPKQRARLGELEGLSDTREAELVALEEKGDAMTADEKTRHAQLMQIAAQRAPALAAEERRLTEERQKRNRELSEPFNKSIESALEKTAEKSGVQVIFTKEVVLWSKVDLTEAVLEELNGKKPAK